MFSLIKGLSVEDVVTQMEQTYRKLWGSYMDFQTNYRKALELAEEYDEGTENHRIYKGQAEDYHTNMATRLYAANMVSSMMSGMVEQIYSRRLKELQISAVTMYVSEDMKEYL